MLSIYWVLVTACIVERIVELFISRRNRRRLLERGYSERESKTALRMMVLVHVSWFCALIVEPVFFSWNVPAVVPILALVVFLSAQLLRFWVLTTLGREWNISVMSGSDSGADCSVTITHGPYRYIRHPNYLAVILEIFSLPLVGGALLTAVVFSFLNAVVLARRISLEEQHLLRRPEYDRLMADRPRFLPQLRVRPAKTP
jgi:methyltransferase